MKLINLILISLTIGFIVIPEFINSENASNSEYLQVVKRSEPGLTVFREKRSNTETNLEDEEEELNRFALNKYRIEVPLNGEKINICEKEYLKMASTLHPRLKETLIAACSGSSTAKWIVRKAAKFIFKKDL